MQRFFSNDVTKLLVFLALTFALAALLVPFVYNFGQFFAEITASKSINPFLDAIGKWAQEADYSQFFNRSLYLAGLALLPLLLFALSVRKPTLPTPGPWSFALPPRAIASNRGQALEQPPHRYRQLFAGFAMGAVFLAAAGALALLLGLFQWEGISVTPLLFKTLTTASLVALLEEIIFCGIILGIFLRTFRPSIAIALVASLFAGLHLLFPQKGIAVSNPEGLWAGFIFLKDSTLHLLNSDSFWQQLCPIFLAGVLLGVTRYLTASLWLPIGLHAGWAFAFLLFEKLTSITNGNPSWMSVMIGENLAQGLLPLASLGLSTLIIWVVYREPDYYETIHPESPLDSAAI